MQREAESIARCTEQPLMPAGVRRALIAGVGLVLAGALYLVAVRGDALLLDLSALSQRMFCL